MTLVQPTRILVLGGGGREHALAWKLGGEPGINEVVVAPGSAAIGRESRVRCLPEVDPLDGAAVVAAARAVASELVVVGPEAPLAAGVVDALAAAGIAVFGPGRAAARIESSKAFCRDVAEAAGVPMARGRAFERPGAEALAYARTLAAEAGGVVIKADGLAGGKGVTVCDDAGAAEAALGALDGPLVVEERLIGPEASVIAIADGSDAVALPVSRDHKRLGDGDTGPNTGGMGAFSPLSDLPDDEAPDIVARFHLPILHELRRRGTPFRGALYAGLILTAAGPRLLECNARFGDPETQAIVPRLASALGPVLRAAARGELRAALGRLGVEGSLPTLPGAAVAIVLATAGYPDRPRGGDAIRGLDAAASEALIFHAGTSEEAGGGFVTRGGRVVTVVGRGSDVSTARARAERAADAIVWPGLQRRHDVAADAPAGVGAAR